MVQFTLLKLLVCMVQCEFLLSATFIHRCELLKIVARPQRRNFRI
jgi:hypothetical protein